MWNQCKFEWPELSLRLGPQALPVTIGFQMQPTYCSLASLWARLEHGPTLGKGKGSAAIRWAFHPDNFLACLCVAGLEPGEPRGKGKGPAAGGMGGLGGMAGMGMAGAGMGGFGAGGAAAGFDDDDRWVLVGKSDRLLGWLVYSLALRVGQHQ